MRAVFRVDASSKIGSGHVIRCLTLAERLGKESWDIHFICRDLPGNMAGFVEAKGFRMHLLPRPPEGNVHGPVPGTLAHAGWLGVHWKKDAAETADVLRVAGEEIDWLIVDHYAIDAGWESRLQSVAKRIMVIDDLADRAHHCELLLDQNLTGNAGQRYDGLLEPDCRILLGPRYCLLRREFRDVRKKLGVRNGVIRRMLVYFGGVDSSNETGKVLTAIDRLERPDIRTDVIVGETNPNREMIEARCKSMLNTVCYSGVTNMAEFMAGADLAIGAGGTTTWERCCLGLPALLRPIAQNQQALSKTLADAGAIMLVGMDGEVDSDTYLGAIMDCISSPGMMRGYASTCMKVCDGYGVDRVVSRMIQMQTKQGELIQLRAATMDDADAMLAWQQHPGVRKYSRNSRIPLRDEHLAWLEQRINDERFLLYIITVGESPAGVIRLDQLSTPYPEFEISILVAPEYLGQGIATGALRLVRLLHPEVRLLAEVHAENKASHSLFRACRYTCRDGKYVSEPD